MGENQELPIYLYHVTPRVRVHTRTKQMVSLKICNDDPIQNGGLKRVLISTLKNGCQRYGFLVFKKPSYTFLSLELELKNKVLLFIIINFFYGQQTLTRLSLS